MGADLYIQPLYDLTNKRWQRSLKIAEKRRDQLSVDDPGYRKAQERVNECRGHMYSEGYFHDGYGNALLWMFGLRWWTDIIPLLEDRCLSARGVRKMLTLLKNREQVFEKKLSRIRAGDRQDYRNDYLELQRFLKQAIVHIKQGEVLVCSL